MENNLSSFPFKIKFTILDIFPSLAELAKSPDELTIIFQNLSQFYNLSELLSQKTEIIIPNCLNSLMITINKLNNILATCNFNIKQGEQWITFGYETKIKKMNSNLALSLIDCIKLKINIEILTDEITNLNSTITVNTVNNTIANTINNLISNNINSNITSNNIINYNNNTININNSNLFNYKKSRFNNQINAPKKNNNKATKKNSPKKSLNDIFLKKSPKKKNNNYSNFTFTTTTVNDITNNNIKKKKNNPSTTMSKSSIKKIELSNSNSNFNKTRNTFTINKRNMNNSLLNNNNDFSMSTIKDKNNFPFKKMNTSFGNLNTLNNNIKSKKSKNNNKQMECPEIEIKELHNYLNEPPAENLPTNKLILKKLYANNFQSNNYKSICMGDKRENLLMSLDNLFAPSNKLNPINNNNKNKKKINNSNTCSNISKKKHVSKENYKSSVNDENKVRLHTTNNCFIGNTSNKMENGDLNYLDEANKNNNKYKKIVDKPIDINKNGLMNSSKKNFNDKNDLQITNSVKYILENNSESKLKSDNLNNSQENKDIPEQNTNLNKNCNNEDQKENDNQKDINFENEGAEEFDDNFERLKNDFILLYNEEYVNDIQDDLLKLEVELLYEKMSELIYAYHSQMEEKQIENELLENNLKIDISNIKKYKKLFMNLEKAKFNIENNTKNNKKNITKIKNLNVDINLNELKILQNIFLIKNNKTKKLKEIMMHILEKEQNRNIITDNEKFLEWISICEKNQQAKLKIRNRVIPQRQQTQFACSSNRNNSKTKANTSGNTSFINNGSFYSKGNTSTYRKKAIPPASPICTIKGKCIPGTDVQPTKTLKGI